MKYYCCDQRRREVIKLSDTLINGLEYLEVDDSGVVGDPTRQLTLFVKFLRPMNYLELNENNFRITGGERIKTVEIEWIDSADNLPDDSELVDGLVPRNEFVVIRTKSYGDFSQYTLSLVSGPDSDTPPDGVDPRLSEIQFSFKVQCASDFDCATTIPCPIPPVDNPRLDYLAKDYASFRRLMLALDTGTAIVGPARGDIFTGSGDAAGALAGHVRNAATFHILIPRAAAERYLHAEG